MAIANCYYSFICTRPRLSCHCRKTAENNWQSKQPKHPENSRNERPLVSDLTTFTLQCVCIVAIVMYSQGKGTFWNGSTEDMGTCSFFTKPEQHVAMPGRIGGVVVECLLRTPSNIEDGNGKLLLQFRMHPARAQLPLKTWASSLNGVYTTHSYHTIHAKFNKMCSLIDITYYFKGSEAVNC